MTTARMTSYQPQAHQTSQRAAKDEVAEARPRQQEQQGPAAARATPTKPAGLGAVVDIVA